MDRDDATRKALRGLEAAPAVGRLGVTAESRWMPGLMRALDRGRGEVPDAG